MRSVQTILCVVLLCNADAQVLSTNRVTISPNGAVEVQIITAVTNVSIAPPVPVPMSVAQYRLLQHAYARPVPRPGTQRFQAVKVVTNAESTGTNYLVTYRPVETGTNEITTWGATKARTFKLETEWPTKKDDEFEWVPQ